MLKYILEQANNMKLRVNFAKHNNQKAGAESSAAQGKACSAPLVASDKHRTQKTKTKNRTYFSIILIIVNCCIRIIYDIVGTVCSLE
jgi:hypothetical protein